MPFKHSPEAMISVAHSSNRQESLSADTGGTGGCKDVSSSETGTPSSATDDQISHGATSSEESPRFQPDHAMEDPDKCSTEQAAIASIILQLSQQPAKKRRTRSGGDAEIPKQTPSPPAVLPPMAVRGDNEDVDQAPRFPQPQASPLVQPELRNDAISKLQLSPPMQSQAPRQGAAPAEASIPPSALQALRGGGMTKAAETRKPYRCSKCGAEKKGHVCSARTPAETQPSNAQVVEVKRGDLAARLAARLQGSKDGAEASGESKAAAERRGGGEDARGILLAASKQELERIPFVTSYSAVEVFDQGVLNHPALASGLPVLLKCPPQGWSRVVQLPEVPGQ